MKKQDDTDKVLDLILAVRDNEVGGATDAVD